MELSDGLRGLLDERLPEAAIPTEVVIGVNYLHPEGDMTHASFLHYEDGSMVTSVLGLLELMKLDVHGLMRIGPHDAYWKRRALIEEAREEEEGGGEIG